LANIFISTPNQLNVERLGFVLIMFFPLSNELIRTTVYFNSFFSYSTVCDTFIDFGRFETDENHDNGENINEYNGDIEFKDFSLLMDNKLILKGINLKIKSGEKVLICGRTGSGKSTLISCLLRLHNPKLKKGSIFIGGQNIEDFDLKYLRSSLAFMQQMPNILTATLRDNLDPDSLYSDFEIYEALEKLGLDHLVQKLKTDKNTMIDSSTFSMAVNQMICMARVLLKKSKILILDESISQLDSLSATKTSGLTMDCDATILCVAHKIRYFLGYDRIVVLDSGKIVQDESLQSAIEFTGMSPFQSLLNSFE